jgi:hypothetical protein
MRPEEIPNLDAILIPQSLPIQAARALRREGLLSAGHSASNRNRANATIDRITAWRNARPQTRLRIDQVLAYYARLRNRHHLKLESEAEPTLVEPPSYTRGVKWDLDCYDGTQGLSIRDSQGKRIFHCTMPAGTNAEPLLEFLEWWIDVLEPTQLAIATPSSADAS